MFYWGIIVIKQSPKRSQLLSRNVNLSNQYCFFPILNLEKNWKSFNSCCLFKTFWVRKKAYPILVTRSVNQLRAPIPDPRSWMVILKKLFPTNYKNISCNIYLDSIWNLWQLNGSVGSKSVNMWKHSSMDYILRVRFLVLVAFKSS